MGRLPVSRKRGESNQIQARGTLDPKDKSVTSTVALGQVVYNSTIQNRRRELKIQRKSSGQRCRVLLGAPGRCWALLGAAGCCRVSSWEIPPSPCPRVTSQLPGAYDLGQPEDTLP